MRMLVAGIAVALMGSSALAQNATIGPQDMVAAMASAFTARDTKAASVPASGPGAGLCVETIVPSPMVVSGGVTGSAGTCSLIVQCGTSATYVVKQFNVGSGC